MVAVHDELTRPRVMAVVEDLAAQGATGVLEVRGDPCGALYLEGGHIVFAEASWVPGLVGRLRGLRPAAAEFQQLMAGWNSGDAAAAALAVQRGYLTPARLHELVRSIVVDAFLVLVVPLAENSRVADIRFTAVRTHANTMFPRLDVPSVRGEALSRADRMAKYCQSAAAAAPSPGLRQPVTVPAQEHWHRGQRRTPASEIMREVLNRLMGLG